MLISDLIEAGGLEIITEGLAMINKTADVDGDLQKQLIGTIYSISRHDDGSKQLNALNADDQIKVFEKSINGLFIYLNALCSMTWLLVSTSEQIMKDEHYTYISMDRLVLMMNYATIHDYRYAHHAEPHLSELLAVLVKLFSDDLLVDYIIKLLKVHLGSLTIQKFINLLIYCHSSFADEDPFKQPTCTALVNILWRISFQDNYKEIFINTETNFQELIQNFTKEPDENIASNHYMPKYIETIQKAAQGLAYNIGWSIHPPTEQDNELALPNTTIEENFDPEKTAEETIYSEKLVQQWNKDDISQWFQDSGIHTELRDVYPCEDGYELLKYAKIFLETEKGQHQMYSDEFSRRNDITSGKTPLSLHEFTKFSDALRKLEQLKQ